MKSVVLQNVVLNLIIAVIFIFLNDRAVKLGLEETFISLAIGYGIITTICNALFVKITCKKTV